MPALKIDLHEKQSRAFLSEATEILYGGSAGAGKSHLMRAAAIVWANRIPGLQVYLFRRTFPDLYKNHMEGPTGFPAMLAEWVESGFCSINYSDNQIKFSNGSKVHLCHCQNEKDVYNYQGAEIHFLLMDELTHFTDFMYRYLRGRVRLGGLNVPDEFKDVFPRILCGTNPGGAGHEWVKAAFVDMSEPGQIVRMSKEEGGFLRQFIPARLTDNPTLTKNDPDYINRLEGLGNKELVRAMRDGDWNIVAGAFFADVWSDKCIVQPFEMPSSWYFTRGFDWGSSKPFATVWAAQANGEQSASGPFIPKGSWVIFAEDYGWNGKPNEGLRTSVTEVARRVKAAEKSWPFKVTPGPADSAIFSIENGQSIIADFRREGVDWTESVKGPGSRAQRWQKMRDLLRACGTKDEPGLYFFSTCRHLIRTIPNLPRDDKKWDDIDTNSDDHLADGLAYILLSEKRTSTAVKVNFR